VIKKKRYLQTAAYSGYFVNGEVWFTGRGAAPRDSAPTYVRLGSKASEVIGTIWLPMSGLPPKRTSYVASDGCRIVTISIQFFLLGGVHAGCPRLPRAGPNGRDLPGHLAVQKMISAANCEETL
jgi:hypothetical protein